MPQVDAQQFYKDFEEGKIGSLYLLHGDEPYLLKQGVERFRRSILAEGAEDFNFSMLYSADVDMEQVRDAVETLPMMSDKRLVILREVQDLTDKEWQSLESLFKNPVDSTVFVLVGLKLDKRKRPIRTLMEIGESIEFKKPYDNQVPSWVKHIAKTIGLRITDEACRYLHRLIGGDLIEIDSELQKIANYWGLEQTIEKEHVEKVVTRIKEENVFDLTRSIGAGQKVEAFEHLVHLLDQGQSELGIVSLVARQIRVLLLIKKGQEMGLNGGKLAQFADVPSFFLDQYLTQARHWTREQLEQFLALLGTTDRALKSSNLKPQVWLENLILKIS